MSIRRQLKRGKLVYALVSETDGKPVYQIAKRKDCYQRETKESLANKVEVEAFGLPTGEFKYKDPDIYPQYEHVLK